MRPSLVQPTGTERTFGDQELIVTKTDPKGIISYANDVFLRVSAYQEADVIGAPHNIIRHPDMPRAVYKLMWDTIASGREMFAYVVNLAADGAHYWTFAHVTPSFDGAGRIIGYHSNRRSPERRAVSEIEPLYRRLRDEERRHQRAPESLAASTELLSKIMAERGQDYPEFVWSLTGEENR
jgi:PAS domain S-box-containing protein